MFPYFTSIPPFSLPLISLVVSRDVKHHVYLLYLRQRPFSPSVPAEAGWLFTVAAGVCVFISGESLHRFLVGWCTNKSYVIATSDLWLFIHASNLLPLNAASVYVFISGESL